MNNYLIYLNGKNRIFEYMLPSEDNRQGTLKFENQMQIKDLILSYEIWDGIIYFKSNEYVRLSVEHRVEERFEIYDGLIFNVKTRNRGNRLTAVVHLISPEMTNFVKYDISQKIQIEIGSAPNCDVVLNDSYVSSYHLSLAKDSGYWYAYDRSKNGTFINSVRIGDGTRLNIGDNIYVAGYKIVFLGNIIAINQKSKVNCILDKFDQLRMSDMTKYEDISEFSRAPRFIEQVLIEDVDVESPPQKDKVNKIPLILTIGPALTMPIPILATVLVNAMVNNGGSGIGTYIGMLISVIMFAVIGVGWALYRTKYEKKQAILNENNRVQAYTAYISQNDSYIDGKIEYNRKVMESNYKSTGDLIAELPSNNIIMWNRNINHKDFLTIRMGKGIVDSSINVKVPKERFSVEQDDLWSMPAAISEKYKYVGDSVKTISLKENRIIGVLGDSNNIDNIMYNISLQIAILHSYTDVKMAFIYDEEHDWDWVKWIPHTFSNDKKIRFIGNSEESTSNTIYALTNELRLRAEKKKEDGKCIFKDTYIVFCTNKKFFENETINKYINSEEDYGFVFVLMYGIINNLPNECNFIIEQSNNYSGVYILDESYSPTRDILFDSVNKEMAESIARYMQKFTVSELAEGQIPESVDYFELMGINKIEDWDLIKKYKQNRSYEGLPSLVGVSAGNKPLYLDIHEKKHGPHGLVAGTTGSGKSETIQTFILSLALNYSPNEVAFIIIDYKGGGMANTFIGLPHIAGTITNLGTGDEMASDKVDANQIRRALISIRSEIKKRQALFNQYKVNHIDTYMRLYRDHKASEPLPHLIIISDEFAELKKEQPAFIKELVSTARVGRSLGIHLILATQKPAGVVDDEIWSNSRFKVCLKVQDKQDSQEMLKRPEAAYLTRTGCAYLQIGNDEIFEMFQSGYSGADYDPSANEENTASSVDMIGVDGHTLLVKQQKKKDKNEKKISQLAASVNYIAKVSKENKIAETRPLWLPALSSHIYLEDIFDKYEINFNEGLIGVIGVIDEPARQLQNPLTVNFYDISNMIIAGINGSGKTMALKTLIVSMSEKYTPDEVQFYILDFSSRTLKSYKAIPHVGEVFYPEESEGVNRTVKFMLNEIADRTKIFQEKSIGSFKEYNQMYENDKMPCICLVIDNYYDFNSEYESLEEDILKITRDGSRYGIQVIVGTNRGSDMRYKLRQNFTKLLPLRFVEKGDYLDLVGKSPEFMISDIPGRGIVIESSTLEYQVALPAKGKNELERNENIKKKFEEYDDIGSKVKRITIIPKDIKYVELLKNSGKPYIEKGQLPVGYNMENAEIQALSVNDTFCYVIWGAEKISAEKEFNNMLLAAGSSQYEIKYFKTDLTVNKYASSVNAKIYEEFDGAKQLMVDLKKEFKQRSDRKKELVAAGRDNITDAICQEFGKIMITFDSLSETINLFYDTDNVDKLYPLFELFLKNGKDLGIIFVFMTYGEIPFSILGKNATKTILSYASGICIGGLLSNQKLFNFKMSLNDMTRRTPDNYGCTIEKNKTVNIFIPDTGEL